MSIFYKKIAKILTLALLTAITHEKFGYVKFLTN